MRDVDYCLRHLPKPYRLNFINQKRQSHAEHHTQKQVHNTNLKRVLKRPPERRTLKQRFKVLKPDKHRLRKRRVLRKRIQNPGHWEIRKQKRT